MTTKLYDLSAYDTRFTATVLSSEKRENGYAVALDRTLFFPEEGGQEADGGVLAGHRVLHVSIDGNGVITHLLDAPLTVGEEITGEIDFAFRFRNMQNHTAEHILSGIAHSLYGCENVGFHLGREEITLDFDKPLDEEQLLTLETKANETVFRNLAVTAAYPSKEALTHLSYRAKLALTENVRIVTIEDTDACACCAPHVRRTGEIGLIKIKSAMHYKGGMRLFASAGIDALRDYRQKQDGVTEISHLLSVPDGEVADAVSALLSTNGKLKGEKADLLRLYAASMAESLAPTDKNACLFFKTRESRVLRDAAIAALSKVGGAVAVCGGEDGAYSYVIASKSIDLRQKAKEYNEALSGRGGGNAEMIQGSFAATKTEIEAYFMK